MKRKNVMPILLAMVIGLTPAVSLAHGGRTDSNGGHKDNKNKSGLGSYHYHHGYGAHLHNNGVCPYNSSSSNNGTSSSGSGKSNNTVKSNPKPVAPVVVPTTIKFTSTPNELKVGESGQVEYSINPSDTKDKTIVWKSSDENIATVDDKGNISAINPGQSKITATSSDDKTNSFTLTVTEVKAEKILIKNSVSNIERSGELNLSAELSPQDTTNKEITWSSSDPSVVKVEKDGKLIALAVGKAVITATQKDVSDSFDITVDPKNPESIEITTEFDKLKKGETLTLDADISPGDADNEDIIWTVDNEDIASIEGNVLTLLKPGTVLVTATTINGKTDTIEVEVTSSSAGATGVVALVGAPAALYYVVKKRKK